MAIYNTTSLRLNLLRSPDWLNLDLIQHITSEVLEDCAFFEDEGRLYMALAIQLGPLQYEYNSVGMQCV